MKADVYRETAERLRQWHPAWSELCQRMADHYEKQELEKRMRRLEEERCERQEQSRGIEVSR